MSFRFYCPVFSQMLTAIVEEWKCCCSRFRLVLQSQSVTTVLAYSIFSASVARQRRHCREDRVVVMKDQIDDKEFQSNLVF